MCSESKVWYGETPKITQQDYFHSQNSKAISPPFMIIVLEVLDLDDLLIPLF